MTFANKTREQVKEQVQFKVLVQVWRRTQDSTPYQTRRSIQDHVLSVVSLRVLDSVRGPVRSRLWNGINR